MIKSSKSLVLLLSILTHGLMAKGFNHSDCKLEKSKVLKIGCTKYCGKLNIRGLKKSARKLGYKIQIKNLYSEYSTPDLTLVDAILIPGGVDIDPKYYINEVEADLQSRISSLDHLVVYTDNGKIRDLFEYNLLQEYFSSNLLIDTPVLGICRGMQMLGVSQGIPLYVDIKAELGIPNRYTNREVINVQTKDSELYKIMKLVKFKAVEKHHQGPRVDYFNEYKDRRWPNINLTALSNNNRVAEALEWTNRPVLGVQFHPEYTKGIVGDRIFSWLLKQACHNSNN